MDNNKKTRSELKSYFVRKAVPKEGNFADLIEASLNQKDDGLAKPKDEALSIDVSRNSDKRMALRFYETFEDTTPAWTLNLPGDTGKLGFALTDRSSNTRLFINGANGNVSLSGGLAISGADLQINNASRRGSALGDARRALVHDNGDTLTVNYGADYSGGVNVGSSLTVAGAVAARKGATITGGPLVLRREKGEADGAQIFLDLYQHDDVNHNNPAIFPSIRFLHENNWFHRIEARKDGLHVKHGDIRPEYVDRYAKLSVGDLTANGNLSVNQAVQVGGGISTASLRVNNPTDPSKHFDICFESGNNTVVFYHQSGLGQYMREDGAWNRNSDVALKKNIRPLGEILDKVMRLQPMRFDWKSCSAGGIGFIAQEVEPIFPDVVSTHQTQAGQTLRGLSYDSFGVLAIAAIRELKRHYDARIEALETRIQTLTAPARA